MRIEVGRGLEPQLTDLMTKLIIENAILPAFRRNDFAGGIKAGVRDIRDVLLGDAEAVKERPEQQDAGEGVDGGRDLAVRSGCQNDQDVPAARASGAVTVWIQPRHLGLIISSSAMRTAAPSTALGCGPGAPALPSGALLFMPPE